MTDIDEARKRLELDAARLGGLTHGKDIRTVLDALDAAEKRAVGEARDKVDQIRRKRTGVAIMRKRLDDAKRERDEALAEKDRWHDAALLSAAQEGELREERDGLLAEMHARELHHFEEEQRAAELAAVIERIRRLHVKRERPSLADCSCSPALTPCPTRLMLRAVPADVLRERDAETLREAARFLRDMHSEYEAALTLETYAREMKEQH